MGFGIDSATYGRDEKGIQDLMNNLTGDIDTAVKALDGQEYTTLKSNVKSYWSGADADKFLELLDKSVSDLKEQFKSYKKTITDALSNEYSDFDKWQTQQASNMENNL